MLENFKTSNHRGEWLISSIWKSSAMECQEEIPPIKIVVKAPHDSRNMPCEEVLNIKEKLGCTKCPGDLATSSDELVQCQITKCGWVKLKEKVWYFFLAPVVKVKITIFPPQMAELIKKSGWTIRSKTDLLKMLLKVEGLQVQYEK